MASAPIAVAVRPYRDYLTPVLHGRFTKASRETLLLCYLIACWMGEWDNPLWLWFPIGPTGIRTLLIFVPALIIYVLRVAQMHVGARQTVIPAETFTKYFLRKETALTLSFYMFSAWLYGEVYIWSRTSKDRLGFTDLGRAHERLKLNERPLYLRFLFVVLAIAQSAVHLWDDYDSIHVPAMVPKRDRDLNNTQSAAAVRSTPKPRQTLLRKLPSTIALSGGITGFAFCIGSLVYFVGPRHLIWDYYYSFSRYVISLSKTSRPTGLAPFLPLVFGYAAEGTLLVLLWQFVNQAFDLYITQEPVKNNQPITFDSSDPNGTLLNGLKSKKDTPKSIAFWELALITDAFPDRRKTIYGELERKKAPTYQQVTEICLGEVKFLIERLNVAINPSYTPEPTNGPQQPAPPVHLVPQIARPLQNDKQITTAPAAPTSNWGHIEAATAGIAKSHSSPGNSQQAYGREALHKGLKGAKDGKQKVESLAVRYWNMLLSSYLGWPFRRSLERTARVVVLGAPYSRISTICNAITALTNLTTFSLKHDELGRFHEGVPGIVRVLTTAIKMLDEYMAKVEIHWTDYKTLSKPEAERRKVPEVEQVRECLREGLERILGSFNEYLSGLGMSKLEILEAKSAVGGTKGLEMLQR